MAPAVIDWQEKSGTQTGPFKGCAPSGAGVNVLGITLFHFTEGNIREIWVSFDPARFIET